MSEYRVPAAQLKELLSIAPDGAYLAVKSSGAALQIQVEGGPWVQMGEVEIPYGVAMSESYSSERWIWDDKTRTITRRP